MDSATFAFGSSYVDITPVESIPLAGFAYRNNRPYSGIASRIYLKAFIFQAAGQLKCLLIADILWWPPELIDHIQAKVNKRWGIAPVNLLLHATHTHSAPQTSSRFPTGLGLLNTAWQEFFLEKVDDAIAEAMARLQPARMSRFRGQSHISINRRIEKGIDTPTEQWPEGQIDRELTTLLVQGTGREPLGALVHYACHPTILRGAEVSAEFPGVLCENVEHSLGDSCTVGFLQACCGDVGPNVRRSGSTKCDSYPEVKRIGDLIANNVLQSLRGNEEPVVPTAKPGHFMEVELPYEKIPSMRYLMEMVDRDDHHGEWARLLLERTAPQPSTARLEIQHLPLGDSLTILAFNAEMVTHYGLLVRALSDGKALPCGYSNGMLGYIVTDDQLKSGGYEAEESTRYFGLPSRFATGNQQLVESALQTMLRPNP